MQRDSSASAHDTAKSVQGYLAHKKQPPPPSTCESPAVQKEATLTCNLDSTETLHARCPPQQQQETPASRGGDARSPQQGTVVVGDRVCILMRTLCAENAGMLTLLNLPTNADLTSCSPKTIHEHVNLPLNQEAISVCVCVDQTAVWALKLPGPCKNCVQPCASQSLCVPRAVRDRTGFVMSSRRLWIVAPSSSPCFTGNAPAPTTQSAATRSALAARVVERIFLLRTKTDLPQLARRPEPIEI